MGLRYDVFLSHSTADKPAVEELARKLLDVGITPFLDKWHLVPGEPWQEALEQALDDSRTCAVFLGPGGVGAWQNEEMRSALETRVRETSFRVIPVLLPRSFEPRKNDLPRFLRRLTWVDFRAGLEDEDAFHRLVSGIRGTAPGPGGGGGGPAIPSTYRCMAQPPEAFIHRQEYDEVLEALCPAAGLVQSASVGITTALRGAGGFGKTVLAQALCQNTRVRQTYPDGILWTTMGEDIDAQGRLAQVRDLIRWWTREEAPAFETVSAAGARLRELLARSRVLVVIDDVWSSADVTPFQGLSTGSALLITTRDSQTLPADTARIPVDAMEPAEAVSLLGLGLPDGFSRELRSLAARLGEWALLLKVVNRQLQELVREDGLAVPKALREVEEALEAEGFSAFDRDDKGSRHAAASQAILVSVRRLPENECALYFQLAVFPEDAHVPLSVLERFWGLSHFQARKFCRRLHDLSLLSELEGEKGTIRLHDVVRRVLIEQIEKDLYSLHGRLLDAFRPASGAWPDLSAGESYLWRNFPYHFLGADRRGELRELLLDFSFLAAKLRAADINALIADYEVFAGEEKEPRLIRDALRLSAHVLTRDRRQLASQLYGRLLGFQEQPLRPLLEAALPELWLRPKQANLMRPGGPLIRTLEGHAGGISAVAAVDGRRVVSGSKDGTLRVWDLETGETLRTLEGHAGEVFAVAVVDGHRAVSGSHDRTLRVWDLETGENLRILKGSSGVTTVAVVDGHRAIFGSNDRTLRVWDLDTSVILRALEGPSGITAVAVMDGSRAISGSYDCILRVWDLDTGKSLRTLAGHSTVTAIAAMNGSRAVVSSDNGTLRVWDLDTGKTLRTLKGHSGRVNTVAIVDGSRAVSGSKDWTLRVWNLETGETLQTLEGHSGEVYAVAVVDGRWAVSGSNDRTLRVWDLETGETLRRPEGHSGEVNGVAVVDGYRAVSGSEDRTLRVWDIKTGKTLRTIEGHSGWIYTVAVVDGRRIVSASGDGTLRVWDLDTGKTLRILEGHSREVYGVAVVDGRRVVSASGDGTLRVWDIKTGETLRVLKGNSGGVRSVAVVDGRRVVSGSFDGTLRVWDLETGEALHTLKGHSGRVRSVAVVDGLRTISGSKDGTLRVWDLKSGQLVRTLEGHAAGVNAVAGVDSQSAVSGSDDRTLRVWNLETGETLAVTTLDAEVLAVASTPNGRSVVAGDKSGRMHFFELVEPK